MIVDPSHLSLEEMEILDRVLHGHLIRIRDSAAASDPDVQRTIRALRSVRNKLARTVPTSLCRHCKENPRRGNQVLCDRCRSYKRRTGKLPPEHVLNRSAERRMTRRMSRRTRDDGA